MFLNAIKVVFFADSEKSFSVFDGASRGTSIFFSIFESRCFLVSYQILYLRVLI